MGVQYPREIERGLPSAVKTAAKVVVACQPPALKGAIKKTAGKIKEAANKIEEQVQQQQLRIEETERQHRRSEKQAEFKTMQIKREQECKSGPIMGSKRSLKGEHNKRRLKINTSLMN